MEIFAGIMVIIVCILVGVTIGEVRLWHRITNDLSEFVERETKYYAQKAIDEILNNRKNS